MSDLSFRQRVFAGFAMSVILVFIVGLLSYNSINQSKSDADLVDHTQKVIKTSDHLLQMMIDAETGVRGYGATNNKAFLDPYNEALLRISADVTELGNLVPDNPKQVKRIDTLTNLISIQLNILKENINARESKGLEYMVQNQMFLHGKENMDHIRRVISAVKDNENELLAARKQSSDKSSTQALIIIITGSGVFLIIIILLFYYIFGTFDRQKKIEEEINSANKQLELVLGENKAKNWMLTGLRMLNEKMQGDQTEQELATNVITEICSYTGAVTGTFYLLNEKSEKLEYYSSYAFHNLDEIRRSFRLSEGLLGQAAIDQKPVIIKGKINNRMELASSLLQDVLTETFILPFFFNRKLMGAIEIAYQKEPDNNLKDYILSTADVIGIAVNTAQARSITQKLLEEVQQQAEELTTQQEEMRVTNEELLNKTEELQASEEELKVQQEELRSTNAELEEKAGLLEEKNQAIEEARHAINLKVQELENTSKYKSEFLANMSHELRTPLNSILVLARILKDNKTTNLSEDQIKYASVIFNAGNDLLTLINDILDLAKIESGKLEVQNEEVKVEDILQDMEMLFAEVAGNKQIKFTTSIGNVPKYIFTDKMRLEQVMKNLLSNAFKFTPGGGAISINVMPGAHDQTISFSIKDTGIGIAADKQKVIFEAFQQADGSTSRKYGGTGLGLSISRELATLLSGTITLNSEPGKGSEFIITIPVTAKGTEHADEQALPTAETFDLRSQLLKPIVKAATADREPLVVIVEDDKNFADILKDYSKEHGYRSIIVNEGTHAVEIIKQHHPDAVIMDIMLPGKDGWQILKELKQSEDTAYIPVHLMSAGDAASNRVRREGAISFLKKPIDTDVLSKLFNDMKQQSGIAFKQILLIEDHESQSSALKELMEGQGITVDQAFDGDSAFRMVNANDYQCLILDLNLPDISGLDLLDKIKAIDRFASLPVIVNTAMALEKASVNRLMQYANAMVVKTHKSSDRLIDEVNLFLNKISSPTGEQTLSNLASKGKFAAKGKNALKGKKVLVVDDDMRNIFALSSALQTYDLQVEVANDGEEAIAKLEEISDIDIVLMDIMMPKMDGYEATRYIRKQNKWAKLPVIALTAKAMSNDRDKCIAAGANDYITKPVDIDRLIALIQLWLEN